MTSTYDNLIAKLSIQHILIFGFLVRLLALWLVPNQHFPDASAYTTSGLKLFHGESINPAVMPLYPIMSYLSGGGWKQLVLDCLFSTGTIYLVYQIALQLFKRHSVGVWAALATAIYPFFIFYAISGLTESSYIFFLTLCFYFLYRQQFLWGCIIAVTTILIRPTTDLLNPLLILAFVLLVHKQHWRQGLKWVAVYFGMYAILLSPWWLYNYQRFGSFVRLDLGSGVVLYSGNNPLNKSGGGIDGADVNFKAFDQIKDPVARNAALTRAAIQYIEANPWHVVKLDMVKFLRFWRLYPYAPSYTNVFTIMASLLSFGVMLLLCCIYLGMYLKEDWQKIAPILLLALYLTAVHSVTIGSIRYRLPLEPFIIILGAVVIDELSRKITTRRLSKASSHTYKYQ